MAIEPGDADEVAIAGTPAAAFGEQHQWQPPLLGQTEQAVGLLVVHHPLGAGEHRVVVGQHQAARGLCAKAGGAHAAGAGHQAIGGAEFQQFFRGAPTTLGGQGEATVFAEAALIQQVEHVLPRGALAAPAPPRHRLRAAGIAQCGLAIQHFGEVGADMRQVRRLFDLRQCLVAVQRFQEQQRPALFQGVSEARGERADDAAASGLDLEFHLHRFHQRDALAGPQSLALGHLQGDQHASARRRQRQAARRRLLLARRRRCRWHRLGMPGRMLAGPGCQQRLQLALDETGADPVGLYRWMQQEIAQQVQVARHALQAELAERPVGPAQRGGIIRATHDQLGQQRVVAGVDAIAGVTVAVHPQTGAAGRFVGVEGTAGRARAAVGGQGLQVDPQLYRATAGRRWLRQAQAGQVGAGGEAQLGVQQVDPGDLLGDGVLHLDARVGLHEVEPSRPLFIDQELEGADALVAHRPGHAQGAVDQRPAGGLREVRAGRDLQQLLLAPLQTAVSLPEMADRAAAVAKDLHLDMSRPRHQLLDVQLVAAERRLRLGAAAPVGLGQLRDVVHRAYAAPAAAGQGLEHHRGAGAQVSQERFGLLQADRAVESGHQRHFQALGQGARGGLVAEQVEHLGLRPDEANAGALATAGELGVLGEKAIARMDRVARLLPGHGDQPLHVQVGRRPAATQRHRDIGLAQVQGGRVVLGVHRHRADAQVGTGAGDADGDLATVGDQQGIEGSGHGGFSDWRSVIRRASRRSSQAS